MKRNMKFYLSLLPALLIALFLASCSNSPVENNNKEVSITAGDIPQSVGLNVGDTLEVVLTANPSTGYRWEAGFYNQTVLKLAGEPEFVKQSTSVGSYETQKVHFVALSEGETELVLVYKRSFEKAPPESKTFIMGVVVE